ncbi:HesA/MoeB/ThiF family protein [bacterium]|nr:HesA/MoeB/ThiF family protein [bacterium]
MATLTKEDRERYGRQIIMPDIGIAGQEKILNSKILVIGVGGLGSPAAFYLAAAGVGTLGLVDSDTVDLSNLQRQILHATPDLGRPKVVSAAEKLRALNPRITVTPHQLAVKADNIGAIIREYDFVISATDTFKSKYLINDACLLEGVPFSHGGVIRYHGQTLTVIPWKTACFRCVFDEPPPTGTVMAASEAGVLGSAAGLLGTIQATEAIKYVCGTGELLTDVFLSINASNMDFQKIKLSRHRTCPVCGENPTVTGLTDLESVT